MDDAGSKSIALIGALIWAVALLAAGLLAGCGGGDDDRSAAEKDLQTVSFQKPKDPGPDPFTEPADVESTSASTGNQPFGGSGSNRVCDRDKLIRFLEANPERLRAWARVLGVRPEIGAVKRYIARLHPVTLTRDTRITNHAFRNGRAVPFQAILQAGTAVLVDKYGNPVVRCYCGNPLKPAVFTQAARCSGCPPNYKPPRQCDYGVAGNYDEVIYRRDYYSNSEYDEVFIRRQRRGPYGDCYAASPDPPMVTIVQVFKQPPPAAAPSAEPAPAETETTPAPTETETTPAEPQQAEPECDVAHFRANQCADIKDKSTDPGIQEAP